ncbi:hypothetical protein GUITHDRAFT_153825 [Guillardia theta CCMP2712]|uniref:SMP-30/Gluconolactonase/LRE-like region domain-containing protein n=2 Tax=Guillardia theta TaxID=55529 RepID=L1IZL0_GUITC|nr:hypothetical protein GUITHDRAFT_153825 [Guillardia theta CCMP2712]EKX41527.1 hypothetical protein GUITHDRAFT_153825 [Guillardia theta CCMP2712]|eukprot:XP_005828507.1 hypothetical protein GUITHDRAFT_153825 [Guillardia theta CCMP2712]
MELFVADAYNQAVRRVSSIRINVEAKSMEDLVHADVVTIAGHGAKGHVDGPVGECKFCYPHDVLFQDMDGAEHLLVADFDNNCIRKVFITNGVGEHVVTWAGSNLSKPGLRDGSIKEALFNHPGGISADQSGENIFIADTYNHAIRHITRDEDRNWTVTLIAGSRSGQSGFEDGEGESARFNCPTGLAVVNEQEILISDFSNSAIRLLRRVRGDWLVTTVVGKTSKDSEGRMLPESGYVDGPVDQARLNRPHGVAWDEASRSVLIADCMNHRIRRVQHGHVSTLV